MDIRVIIVSWNNEKEIARCLRSVLDQRDISREIVVIDNGSTDGTAKIIEGLRRSLSRAESRDSDNNNNSLSVVEGFRFIPNITNRGFAAAVNQGLADSNADYVVLLNPDAELVEGSLSSMVRFLREHPEAGVVGGKVLNHNGSLQPSVRRFPTLADQSVILLKLHRFFPQLVARYLATDFDYEKEGSADQVRGAYFFISRKVIEKVGLMDEANFFIWFEEVDYCKRVKDAGLEVLYYPGSLCRHAGGASFAQQLSVKKQKWLNRSMINYFKKHSSQGTILVLQLIAPIAVLLAAIASLVPEKFKRYV